MILDLHSTLRVVFTIFAIAWIGIVVVLFVATGLLLKRAERSARKEHGEAPGHH